MRSAMMQVRCMRIESRRGTPVQRWVTRLRIGIQFSAPISLGRRFGGVKRRAEEEGMRRRNANLRRAKRSQWAAGGWIGAGTAAIAGLEILLGNPASCSPRLAPASCLLVIAAFAGVGLVLGAAFGVLGARLFAALRGTMQDGRSGFGFLAPALVFLPGL